MSARSYSCPACGAQVEEQARHCRYCSAPVATVRCATCFHMNVPEASYCSGCGNALGLEPVGEDAALSCPVCKDPFQVYRDRGPGALFDCARCGGQFVEHTLLRELLHAQERAALPEAGPRSLHPGRPDPRNSYIPCPVCSALMNRKNFGMVSGVVVDVCKKHGTYFDLGELPRVLAFVAAGGLEKTRRREAEDAADAHRRAVAAATSAALAQPHLSSRGLHGEGYREMASLAQSFLDMLLH